MRDIRTTNILLLIIAIPVIFYLMHILSFILVPLFSSMFIALLFLPLMRWLNKKKVPKPVSIFTIVLLLIGVLSLGIQIIKLTTREILAADNLFFKHLETKVITLVESIEGFFGIVRLKGDNILIHYFQKSNAFENVGTTLDFIGDTLSLTLMTVFFVVLFLSESINFQQLLNATIFKSKHSSVRTFAAIEKDVIVFVGVKFFISLLTGVGFSLACLAFGVSFPIFWGLFAFVINFVQMIGSVISIVLLSLFAFVEMDPTGSLLFFILTITAVQVLMGSILEPIFMGKTFSINVVTVLVMLMLWGFIWGIPGLIMSVPLTVIIKIILSQFPKTKVISDLMAGSSPKIKI